MARYMVNKILKYFSHIENHGPMRTFNFRILSLFFVITAVVALIIQLLILPLTLPALHAGHGLLVGGDWVGFHQIAHDLSQKIRSEGWSAWELRPRGHSPAGIAAVFYTVSVSEPYVLIPFNAAVHALSGVILMAILRRITGDHLISFLSVIPFIAFPSAATWYAQIHRDGYYILGMLLFCYGWVQIVTGTNNDQAWWRPSFVLIVAVFFGTVFVWAARPYAFYLLFAVSLLLTFFIMLLFVWRELKKRFLSKKAVVGLLSAILISGSFHLLIKSAWLDDVDVRLRDTDRGGLVSLITGTEKPSGTEKSTGTEKYSGNERTAYINKKSSENMEIGWKRSEWLPERVDTLLFSVARSRQDSIVTGYPRPDIGYLGAKSAVDEGVGLYSATDFVEYFPRALQVALLAPFPYQWFDTAGSVQGGIMRKVAAVEMIFVYASLMWLPFAFWRWRWKAEMWVVMLFATPLLTLYGYVMPNVGTLYRMRYGFLMIIVGVALAAFLSFVLQRRGSTTTRSSWSTVSDK